MLSHEFSKAILITIKASFGCHLTTKVWWKTKCRVQIKYLLAGQHPLNVLRAFCFSHIRLCAKVRVQGVLDGIFEVRHAPVDGPEKISFLAADHFLNPLRLKV